MASSLRNCDPELRKYLMQHHIPQLFEVYYIIILKILLSFPLINYKRKYKQLKLSF